MGADGGVEWIRLREPNKYERLMELIRPFWQIGYRGERSGCASYNVDKHYEWMEKNPKIGAPTELLGFYGTDRGNLCSLETFRDMLVSDDSDIVELTFEELDEYFRTYSDIDSYTWYQTCPAWYRCWKEHFENYEHEEACEHLSDIKNMKISEWITEIKSILDKLIVVWSEETWT